MRSSLSNDPSSEDPKPTTENQQKLKNQKPNRKNPEYIKYGQATKICFSFAIIFGVRRQRRHHRAGKKVAFKMRPVIKLHNLFTNFWIQWTRKTYFDPIEVAIPFQLSFFIMALLSRMISTQKCHKYNDSIVSLQRFYVCPIWTKDALAEIAHLTL